MMIVVIANLRNCPRSQETQTNICVFLAHTISLSAMNYDQTPTGNSLTRRSYNNFLTAATEELQASLVNDHDQNRVDTRPYTGNWVRPNLASFFSLS